MDELSDALARLSVADNTDAGKRLRVVDKDADLHGYREFRRRAVFSRYLTIYRTLADPAYLDLARQFAFHLKKEPGRTPQEQVREGYRQATGHEDDINVRANLPQRLGHLVHVRSGRCLAAVARASGARGPARHARAARHGS